MQASEANVDPASVLMSDPVGALRALDQVDAEGSLRRFVDVAWPVIEPGTPMTSGWVIDAICEHLEAVSRSDLKRLVINVPPGCMKPVDVSAMVTTDRGRISLGQVEVGDRIGTHRGRMRQVVAVHEQGVLPLLEIRTHSGRIVRAAPDHPFLTPTGWIQLQHLKVGDFIAAVIAPEPGPDSITVEEARLLGYLVGDGSTKFRSTSFTNQDPWILQDAEICAHSLGFTTSKRMKGKTTVLSINQASRKKQHDGQVMKWREHHGLDGASSYTKRIPFEVLASSNDVLRAFMGAYWSCDGHIGVRHPAGNRKAVRVATATTVSHGLAMDLQHALLRLGIDARVRRRERAMESKRQPGGKYVSYEILTTRMNEVSKFADWEWLTPIKRAVAIDAHRTEFSQGPLISDEVVSIEKVDPGRCRCLTVDEDSSFTANDFAVHNSLLVDVLWPAWEWGPFNAPHIRYVCASYSDKITIRDNLKTRALIQSDIYQGMWGDRFDIDKDQNAKSKFQNNHMGFKIATSVGGMATGERGHRFLIDDPHNVKDAESEKIREETLRWFASTVPTRIVDPETSAIIVIMQRVHALDVSGLILAKELGYEWLCLPMEYEKYNKSFTSVPREGVEAQRVTLFRRDGEPLPRWLTEDQVDWELAQGGRTDIGWEPKYKWLTPQDRRADEGDWLWPERFSPHHIEEELKPQLRSWGGTYAEAGQLQQRPAPREGGMMQRKDFQIMDELPKGGRWVRGWDFAASVNLAAKFSVGLKMGLVGGQIWISDIRRKRVTPGQLESLIQQCCAMDGKNCEQSMPQDPGQAGKYQKAALAKMMHGENFHFSPETGSKTDRAKSFAAQVEAGNVYLLRAPWNDTFINEATQFPNGEFTDQIDGASRSYGRLLVRRPRRIGIAPMIVGV